MVKTPWLIRKFFSDLTWRIPGEEKTLYLTFDDGPHPAATSFVLEQLEKYNAKATFFCLGKNVVAYPSIYSEIMRADHAVGNHTFNHVNGWKVKDKEYFNDIIEARKYIDSSLFRPPYGKITTFQAKHLSRSPLNFTIVMWDVLSKDYNTNLTAEDCAFNVMRHAEPGSVIVFHDSEKAFPRMQKALTSTLQFFSDKGYGFKAISVKEKIQE
jgi:peptidoglycan-N-acetylglucosamine deacetylase